MRSTKSSLLQMVLAEFKRLEINNRDDWPIIEPILHKAKAIIANEWPKALKDFQELTKTPVFSNPEYIDENNILEVMRFDSYLTNPNKQTVKEFNQTQKASSTTINAGIIQTRSKSIISFLEGLLSLDTETQITQKKNNKSRRSNRDKRRVFIVHGRDDYAKVEVARFVEKLKLEAVILHEQTNSGRTIIEKLEHFSDVEFALVLLTPDDLGALEESQKNLKARARQNVIFELGYLIGKLGRSRVCALLKGDIEKPTDYDGVIYIVMDENEGWKKKVLNELLALNIPVKIEDFAGARL